jgi:hypothetical protein
MMVKQINVAPDFTAKEHKRFATLCSLELNMIVAEEHLVCTRLECGAEFVIKREPAIKKQNALCACGSELKKIYHSPVLKVFETAAGPFPNRC